MLWSVLLELLGQVTLLQQAKPSRLLCLKGLRPATLFPTLRWAERRPSRFY
jgi:hypothetical protein